MTFGSKFTDEEIIAAVEKHGSNRKAAAALGMGRRSVDQRMQRIKRKQEADPAILSGMKAVGTDLIPSLVWSKVPAKDGEPGYSVLLKPEKEQAKTIADEIKEAFEDWQPPTMPAVIRPECDSDQMTVYIATDWHIGMYAWAGDAERDWDLSIAREAIYGAFEEVVAMTPKSGHALFLGLGDLLHFDNMKGVTEGSGNIIDYDTRYPKVSDTASWLVLDCITAMRRKHTKVKAVLKPGNHDETFTYGLQNALHMTATMSKMDGVEVDMGRAHHWFDKFGCNLIGAGHGDKTKASQIPLLMANREPIAWGQCSTKHYHSGHIHHDTLKEDGGVHVYSHRAPIAQDEYHYSKGYLSGRSMRAFVYHTTKGFKAMLENEIK